MTLFLTKSESHDTLQSPLEDRSIYNRREAFLIASDQQARQAWEGDPWITQAPARALHDYILLPVGHSRPTAKKQLM